jgi:hypothetical protein
MECVAFGGTAVTERSDRTAQGYRRFRCRDCGKQFTERTRGIPDRAQYPSDVIALVGRCCMDPRCGWRPEPDRRRVVPFSVRKPAVPFKHHAEHRHHIPKRRFRVTNWPEYDVALRRRGSLTVWFTGDAVAAWRAEPRNTAPRLGASHIIRPWRSRWR